MLTVRTHESVADGDTSAKPWLLQHRFCKVSQPIALSMNSLGAVGNDTSERRRILEYEDRRGNGRGASERSVAVAVNQQHQFAAKPEISNGAWYRQMRIHSSRKWKMRSRARLASGVRCWRRTRLVTNTQKPKPTKQRTFVLQGQLLTRRSQQTFNFTCNPTLQEDWIGRPQNLAAV